MLAPLDEGEEQVFQLRYQKFNVRLVSFFVTQWSLHVGADAERDWMRNVNSFSGLPAASIGEKGLKAKHLVTFKTSTRSCGREPINSTQLPLTSRATSSRRPQNSLPIINQSRTSSVGNREPLFSECCVNIEAVTPSSFSERLLDGKQKSTCSPRWPLRLTLVQLFSKLLRLPLAPKLTLHNQITINGSSAGRKDWKLTNAFEIESSSRQLRVEKLLDQFRGGFARIKPDTVLGDGKGYRARDINFLQERFH